MNDRVRRLQGRIAGEATAGPGPSPEYDEYVWQMNRDRAAIDAADREALGNPADFDFGDRPPEQPEPEDEPVSGGGDWYGDMLLELRAAITDDHPKAEVMDIAIAQERKKQQRQKGAT